MRVKRKVETWVMKLKMEESKDGGRKVAAKDKHGKGIYEETDIKDGVFLGWGIDYDGGEHPGHQTAAIIERHDGSVELVYFGRMRFTTAEES